MCALYGRFRFVSCLVCTHFLTFPHEKSSHKRLHTGTQTTRPIPTPLQGNKKRTGNKQIPGSREAHTPTDTWCPNDRTIADGKTPTTEQIIVTVALVPPKKGVFQSAVKHVLAVATTVEVILLAITYEGGDQAAGGNPRNQRIQVCCTVLYCAVLFLCFLLLCCMLCSAVCYSVVRRSTQQKPKRPIPQYTTTTTTTTTLTTTETGPTDQLPLPHRRSLHAQDRRAPQRPHLHGRQGR